ncbi:MAG: hypothetical protein ACREOI_09400 [bacterium]
MIRKTNIGTEEWLEVIRAPRMKVLRAHLFGITLGVTALLAHLIFAPSGQRRFFLLLAWYLIGYLFGATFSLLYNRFAYVYLNIIHPEWMKLWFYYNPTQEVNIIKTPNPNLDWTSNSSRARYETALYKVFDYKSYPAMKHPYTIVFVANSRIETRTGQFEDDPILDNISFFLKAVERALFSFEFNEVVGRPDILSKLRIVTVTPLRNPGDSLAIKKGSAFVREFSGNLEVQRTQRDTGPNNPGAVSTFADRMLRPSDRVVTYVRNVLPKHIEHIDVIFLVSASATHDISTADVSSEDDWQTILNNPNLRGEKFTFSIDPYCQKGEEILKNDCECSLCKTRKERTPGACTSSNRMARIGGPDRLMIHEHFPSSIRMGKVAINALDVRTKLPIHEFAHAMSSEINGHIVDEYFDYLLIHEENETPRPRTSKCPNSPVQRTDPEYPNTGILVNRIYRNPELMRDTHEVKVHNIFARYNGHVYESDRQHHSDRQGWYSYFPERRKREVLCTMDAAQDVFEFDELLRDFIYDRLWAKVNR